jgi:SAM-dependent methyltransferase
MALLRVPFRNEQIEMPTPGVSGVDIVEDLVGYTGLGRDDVVALVRRRHENFRTEWHAFPSRVRKDAWFYLASRTYLFGNAEHDGEAMAEALHPFLGQPRQILDFGGGTGNLALALALRGHRLDYLERSALQKDFVRYRITKYALAERVHIVDQWESLEPDAYDVVCAMDVFEHVETLSETLASVLRAIRPHGMLAESSPFIRNVQNPMHHEGAEVFEGLMIQSGFECQHEGALFRVWKRSVTQHGD